MRMIKLDLQMMGFNRRMIDALLDHEVIEDTNQAVDMMIKGGSGWIHKFIKRPQSDSCIICGEEELEHLSER